MRYAVYIFALTFSVLILNRCTVKYSMGGATIESDVHTITIEDFTNRAPSGPATLGNFFTNEMKDKFQSQTNLEFIQDDGDLTFRGEITDYFTKPAAITAEEIASQTRLTITVHVVFINRKHPENNFEADFSHYADFPASESLNTVEDGLIEEISEKLIDDIFNKSVVNW